MTLKVVSTGSAGNCYILTGDDGRSIVIEAGVPYKKILKALDFNLKDVQCVCVSHEHADHSKAAPDFKKQGIPVFDRYDSMKEKQFKCFGDFQIYSFKLVHDVPCMGFYILHPEMGSLVYISDTEYCKYKFSLVNHILIEANYDKRMINRDHPAREHILRGHMELQTTKNFILANKSHELRNVILCHMSENNIDYELMKDEVRDVAGSLANVMEASPGLTVELKRAPF